MAFYEGTGPKQWLWHCDKLIGPSFESELVAHGGIMGEHFSWIVPGFEDAPATIEFFEDTPQSVIDGVLSVYEAHEPTRSAAAEL